MKQISCGYGAMGRTGYGVSLQAFEQPGEGLEDALLMFSCYPPAMPKIRQCLETSGRYDCWLQAAWFEHQYEEVLEALFNQGVHLMIMSRPLNKPKLPITMSDFVSGFRKSLEKNSLSMNSVMVSQKGSL